MTREEKDKKLGVLPLHESLCDDCSRRAYTRWYANHGTKQESVAATLCEAHNFAFLKRNDEDRARFGLPPKNSLARSSQPSGPVHPTKTTNGEK